MQFARARTRLAAGLAALACLAAGAPQAFAQGKVVEALGAVPLREGETPRTPPRDAALRRGLLDGVLHAALEMLPGSESDEQVDEVARALGSEPLEYATRFRIIEDRGPRPALLSEDPTVESEYVVLVEVHVDTGRVRSRLAEQGLLAAPSGDVRQTRVRVVIEDVGSWAAYRAVKTLLDEVGVRSAVPVEMERGRAVLDVEGRRGPEALLSALLRAAPPNLRIVRLDSDATSLTLSARFAGGASAAAPGAWGELGE